jgi:hypothetical protein
MTIQQQKDREAELALLTKHKEDIKTAASSAVEVIADAASRAAKVVAEAAAVSVKVLHEKNADDHDLLIELKTGMAFIRDDIKELTSGITFKISELEKGKADKDAFDKLKTEIHTVREARMRSLENKYANVIITLGLYTLAVLGMIALIVNHLLKT